METLSRRRFTKAALTMAVLGYVGRFMAACGAAALPFITMGLNLIGTILPTIPSIIAAIQGLTGKTIPVAAVTKLTSIFTGIQDLFSQAEAALNQFSANNDPTLLTKIRDILGQVQTRLANIFTDTQITDPATVAKLTLIVNSFVDLANTILSILPTVTNGKVMAKRVSKAQMARVTPDAWANRFNSAVDTHVGSTVVDEAFAKVKAVAKH